MKSMAVMMLFLALGLRSAQAECDCLKVPWESADCYTTCVERILAHGPIEAVAEAFGLTTAELLKVRGSSVKNATPMGVAMRTVLGENKVSEVWKKAFHLSVDQMRGLNGGVSSQHTINTGLLQQGGAGGTRDVDKVP